MEPKYYKFIYPDNNVMAYMRVIGTTITHLYEGKKLYASYVPFIPQDRDIEITKEEFEEITGFSST